MNDVSTYVKLSSFLFFAFAYGCATTGNPTQGGIFWSEKKSQQRLEGLRETQTKAQTDQHNALADQQQHQLQKQQITSDIQQLQSDIMKQKQDNFIVIITIENPYF